MVRQGPPTINDHGKHRTVDEMIHQRIGDYEAFKAYQRAVFDRTEAHLATMDPADLTRVLIAPPLYPPEVASTSAPAAPVPGRHRARRLRCWHYQHGLRHMGEIEPGPGPRRPRRHDLVATSSSCLRGVTPAALRPRVRLAERLGVGRWPRGHGPQEEKVALRAIVARPLVMTARPTATGTPAGEG